MTTSTATKTSTWTIDAAHSDAEFSLKHMMISTVKGRFRTVAGQIRLDEEQPEASSVTATIEAASVDTGVEMRDNHLRSADFFDADDLPGADLPQHPRRTRGRRELARSRAT